MTDDSLPRRSVLGLLATASSGCVGRVLDPPSVTLTGVRLYNYTDERASVYVELFRAGDSVIDEQVSIPPRSDPRPIASFTPGWSVDPARYRIRLEQESGNAMLDVRLPPDDFAWNGCAYVDADLENGWSPARTPTPGGETWFEMHLEEVTDTEDFSANQCPDL